MALWQLPCDRACCMHIAFRGLLLQVVQAASLLWRAAGTCRYQVFRPVLLLHITLLLLLLLIFLALLLLLLLQSLRMLHFLLALLALLLLFLQPRLLRLLHLPLRLCTLPASAWALPVLLSTWYTCQLLIVPQARTCGLHTHA